MLGIFQIPLEECERLYRQLGSDVFKQNVIVGTMKMGWSHAFYDSEIWENILKLVCSAFLLLIFCILPPLSSVLSSKGIGIFGSDFVFSLENRWVMAV